MAHVFWNRMRNTLQIRPKSLILATIERVCGTSYWSSVVTLVLSCPVSEILQLLYTENHFPIPTPIPAKISGCSLWSRCMMSEFAERTKARADPRWNYFRSIPTDVTTIPQRDRQFRNNSVAVFTGVHHTPWHFTTVSVWSRSLHHFHQSTNQSLGKWLSSTRSNMHYRVLVTSLMSALVYQAVHYRYLAKRGEDTSIVYDCSYN